MGPQPAISHSAPIQDVAPPDELMGLSRLGAHYPDAIPARTDTLIRMAFHAVTLSAVAGFLIYCCLS